MKMLTQSLVTHISSFKELILIITELILIIVKNFFTIININH